MVSILASIRMNPLSILSDKWTSLWSPGYYLSSWRANIIWSLYNQNFLYRLSSYVMIFMWQLSIFYKIINLNHIMSFYMRVGIDWDSTWYKEDRSLLLLLWHRYRSMDWIKVPKPACVHFLLHHFRIYCLCIYLICICVCICTYVYLFRCLIVIFFFYVYLSLVLGFIVQAEFNFHMCRNAPWLSYWKWFLFCIFVPLIVKTAMSISDFHIIFRICDRLH